MLNSTLRAIAHDLPTFQTANKEKREISAELRSFTCLRVDLNPDSDVSCRSLSIAMSKLASRS